MVNRPLMNYGRLCTGAFRRHGFFFAMVFSIVCVLYGSAIMFNWSFERRMKHQAIPLDHICKCQKQHVTHTSSGTPGPELRLHTLTNATASATSKTKKTTLKDIPVPYVSPGPYLVEYPYEYHFVINESQKCEQETPFLVLVVPVAPKNKAHRDIIRATWGNESLVNGKVVKLIFLLGLQVEVEVQQQLLQESKEHRDLVQSDFIDSYKNLTIKTMVMLEWLHSYCPGASYAMKIDSHMFLNVANLVNMLRDAPKTNYLTGSLAHNAIVLRNPSSKWYLPYDIYPQPTYPSYALGLGYVLSLDLVEKLIEASRHVKPVYIEDVFLGLCMQYLRISPTNPPSRNYFHVFPLTYNRCRFSTIIATTTYEHTDLVSLWKDFQKPGPYC